MKTVFLVIYLYTKLGYSGGPILEIHRFETMAQCQAVAEAAKRTAIKTRYGAPDTFEWECVTP